MNVPAYLNVLRPLWFIETFFISGSVVEGKVDYAIFRRLRVVVRVKDLHAFRSSIFTKECIHATSTRELA